MAIRRDKKQAQTEVSASHVTPNQLWIAIAHVYRSMSSLIERGFMDAGLNLTDFMLLEALLHRGRMTITEIQHAALLATGSMTVAVDRLESKGLIVRTLSSSDRRVRLLELTEQGDAFITEQYAKHSGQLRHWMASLSDEERSAAFASLRKLEKGLRAAASTRPN